MKQIITKNNMVLNKKHQNKKKFPKKKTLMAMDRLLCQYDELF